MNFERQDIGLGLFVLGAAGAVVAALVLVLGAFKGESITLGVYVDSVANVRTGSAVFVSGYRVGELTRIEPVYEPTLRFRISLAVDAEFPLYEGTRAQIVAPGIIGDAIVNLQLPQRASLRLTDGSVIEQAPSIGLTEIASRADSLARSLEGLSGRLAEILSPEVTGRLLDQVTRTLSNTTNTLGVIEDRFVALTDSLLYGMQVATQSIRLVSDVLNENRTRISSTLDSTNAMVGELRGAMRSAGEVFSQERPSLERSLADLEAILREMRTLSEDMNRYSLWQMLFKKRHEEPPE
jgi:ABC-type transporter Mla subunit MlaD